MYGLSTMIYLYLMVINEKKNMKKIVYHKTQPVKYDKLSLTRYLQNPNSEINMYN